MQILMLNLTNFANIEGGTIHQMALLGRWRENGNHVQLVAPRRNGAMPSILGVSYSPTVVDFGLPPVLDTFLQIPALLHHRFRHGRGSIVYSRINLFTVALVALSRVLGLRVVVEHNSWCASERRMRGGSPLAIALEKLFQTWSARLANASRCVTAGIAAKLAENGVPRDKLFALGNGTDTTRFHPVDRTEALSREGLDASTIWLGFIGILARWQGLETAVRGFIPLAVRHPALRLLIAGDGPERQNLEKLAAASGLADRVVFLGHVPLERANTVINCFDVALAPFTQARNNEAGLSALKIRDYAATGRIVVTSDVGGNGDLAGRGWLFTHRADDPDDLAAVVEGVLGDLELSRTAKESARRDAVDLFDWKPIADQLEAVMKKL